MKGYYSSVKLRNIIWYTIKKDVKKKLNYVFKKIKFLHIENMYISK